MAGVAEPRQGARVTRLEPIATAADSTLGRIDPTVKLCAAFSTVVAISTFPASAGWRFGAVLVLVALLLQVAGLPFRYLMRRFLAATPFIAVAAAMPFAASAAGASLLALSVAWKAYSAVALLSVLVGTTPIEEIVGSMRRLGAPRGVALVASLMHRYLYVLLDEWGRVARARECRTGGRIAGGRTRVWAYQAAAVFVRGWERSDRVAQAMLARGFQGDFPRAERPLPAGRDLVLGALLPVAVVALRIA